MGRAVSPAMIADNGVVLLWSEIRNDWIPFVPAEAVRLGLAEQARLIAMVAEARAEAAHEHA